MYIMTITAYSYREDTFEYFYLADIHENHLEKFKELFLQIFSDEYDRIDYVIYYYPLSTRQFKCRGVLYE